MSSSILQFYVLKNNPIDIGQAETEFLPWGRENVGNAPTCPRCGRYTGMLRSLPPFRVELTCYGRAFGDIVFGVGENLLVSERFRTLWDKCGLTGLVGFEPVEVRRVKRRRRFKGKPPRYYHVTVAQTRCDIDFVSSAFVWREPPTCPECRIGDWLRYERIVVERGTWGGEDLFVPRGVFIYLASPRFKEFCEQSNIASAVLIPSEKFEQDAHPEENFDRARELLASPLGEDLLEVITAEGYRVRYCPSKNEMVFRWLDGTIELNRPVAGREFWEEIKAGAQLVPPRPDRRQG